MVLLIDKRFFLFWTAALIIIAYSYMPLLLHGFTYPSGDDAYRLDQGLKHFPNVQRYYGHIPAMIVGMKWYFYASPIIVFIGLYLVLKQYSPWTPVLAWIILFMMTPALVMDLDAGSFLSIINLYFLSLLARKMCQDQRYKIASVSTAALLIFHTASGFFASISIVIYAIVKTNVRLLLWLIPVLASGFISYYYLGSSLSNIFYPNPHTEPFTISQYIAYIGSSSVMLFIVTIILCITAAIKGWKISIDFITGSLIIGLIVALPWILTDLTINADRFAKYSAGSVAIITSIMATKSLKYIGGKWTITTYIGIVALLMLGLGIDTTKFWFSMGTYR